MRNFHYEPVNKIFDKMFGKGARQIQADPTLDLTKCNCCDCDAPITCRGCMLGATHGPDSACCPSPSESLIFEHERRGYVSSSEACGQPTPGSPGQPSFIPYQCCTTTKFSAPNVKYSYHYVGKFFKLNYVPTGNSQRGAPGGWPANDLPRLCSYCDPKNHNESGYCDCMDGLGQASIELEGANFTHCSIAAGGCIAPFQNCLCMGEGFKRQTDRGIQRLSHYRRKVMEREPYWRWLLDIMCYDKGNVFRNPYRIYNTQAGGIVDISSNGSLYKHLIGVVHCEHWWEIDRCDENPNVDFAAEGFNVTPNGSCLVPRFWIQSCSGVPLFDFELDDAVNKGLLSQTDIQDFWKAQEEQKTPSQRIMDKLSEGGYIETGDWRKQALDEIKALQGLTFTKSYYSNISIPKCSDFKHLGPVRKKYFDYSSNIPFINESALLNPKKARPNVTHRTENPVLFEPSLQLPNEYLRDPWAETNRPYPTDPGPNAPISKKQEYEAFLKWKDSQWLYMHARPGGWDYVCSGYFGGQPYGSDPTLKIPDLPRRFMTDVITCPDPEEGQDVGPGSSNGPLWRYGGCLGAILGIPQRSIVTDCGSAGGAVSACGPDGLDQGCRSFAYFDVECGPPDPYCGAYPEQMGPGGGCGAIMVDSNCEGMSIVFSRQTAAPCGEDPNGIPYQAKWYTNRVGKAWLYKVNITTGQSSSFCPYICRSLTVPKPIATKFENIYNNARAHINLCKNYYQTPGEPPRCPTSEGIPNGKYCQSGGNCTFYATDGEICTPYHPPFTCTVYCSFSNSGQNPPEPPFNWGYNSNCCSRNPGGTYFMNPNPTNPSHPAFTNPDCKNCGPGGGAGGIYGPGGCPSSLGCCFNCCTTDPPTFTTQQGCYANIDPNTPEYEHIIWVPSVNGFDCSRNSDPGVYPCNPPYPACP
jgi:hypothetical protein